MNMKILIAYDSEKNEHAILHFDQGTVVRYVAERRWIKKMVSRSRCDQNGPLWSCEVGVFKALTMNECEE
jgi:hypothetical protein